MVVLFTSGDVKIDQDIKCLPTEIFAELEVELNKIYDEYRNNMFLAKGNLIKIFKEMSENNFKEGCCEIFDPSSG